MSIRQILVAVDGSNPSFNAGTYAIDLAKRNDAQLIILYIISPVPYSQFGYVDTGSMKQIETIEKEKVQQGAQQVVDRMKQEARAKKVRVKAMFLSNIHQ